MRTAAAAAAAVDYYMEQEELEECYSIDQRVAVLPCLSSSQSPWQEGDYRSSRDQPVARVQVAAVETAPVHDTILSLLAGYS